MTRKCSCISEGGKSSTAKQQQVCQIMDATATERKTQHHFDKLWGRLMDMKGPLLGPRVTVPVVGGYTTCWKCSIFRKINLLEMVIELGPKILRHTNF